MLIYPRIKAHFKTSIIEADNVVILYSEKDHFMLKGSIYRYLIPLLDGSRTMDEIASLLEGQVTVDKIYYALMIMNQKGYIAEATDRFPLQQAAYWEAYQTDAKQVWTSFQNKSVSVHTMDQIDPQPLYTLLESANIRIADEGDLIVVLTNDYLDKELSAFNQWATTHKKTWLLIKANGVTPWIGPQFTPERTACWECLATRLHRNQVIERYAIEQGKSIFTEQQGIAWLPSTVQMAMSLAVTEIAKWVVIGKNTRLANNVITFDTHTLQWEEHAVRRLESCLCCGQSQKQMEGMPAPIRLQDSPKNYTADGGHRIVSPEKTYENLKHLVSPITGIVNHLRKVSDEEEQSIHVYQSGNNAALSTPNLENLKKNLRSQSSGKGMTDIQAKVGAICEALERFSGVFQGNEFRVLDNYKQLGDQAIHPNLCMGFSETQYLQRDAINALKSTFNYVPQPITEDENIEWTPVWSLTHQRFRFLPTSYLYFNYPSSGLKADSNGNASGNSIEEAILQGFFELVERDSVALWWYNRLKKQEIDLDSFEQPYFRQLKEYYSTLQREFWVLDLTSDLNIPAFAAITRRINGPQEEIIFGFGCHFDPELAVIRAVTEMNQMLPMTLNWKEREGLMDHDTVSWLKTATISNQPYLCADEAFPKKRKEDYSNSSTDDFHKDIMLCKQIVENLGMEMLVLDQTRAEAGVNAVKVIIPGLRHFWSRLAPGRLYDVPVKMGWLDRPNKELELNPIAMFL